jgi:hypothetical protein
MTIVAYAMNLIKSNGLKHHQFQQLLADTESEYGNVKYSVMCAGLVKLTWKDIHVICRMK